MASVDYLETVHPLDYPIFQALVSGQFAKRRQPVVAGENVSDENKGSNSVELSSAMMTSRNCGVEVSEMSSISPSTKCSQLAGDEKTSSDIGVMQAGCSGNALGTTDNGQGKLTLVESSDGSTPLGEPSDGSASRTGSAPTGRSGMDCQPSTSQQTNPGYLLQRSPAVLCTAISAFRRKKHPRHEKKAVSFLGFRRLFHPRGAVCGTFHHNSSDKGLSSYRGSQTTSMAVTAIMASKSLPVHTWISSDIDAILRSGDRLHGQLMSELEIKPADSKLSLHHVQSGGEYVYTIPAPNPNMNSWFEENPVALQMNLQKSVQYQGQVGGHSGCSKLNMTGDISMEDALSHIFDYGYDGALITVGNTTGAVMRDFRGNIHYFDAQSNNKMGQPVRNGTAVLLKFSNIRQFVYYVKRKEKNSMCSFDVLGVSFKVLGRFVLGQEAGKHSQNSKTD